MGYSDSFLLGFLVQSVIHSVVALILVEATLRIWEVQDPRERFRHRMVILLAPLLMFPVFQLLSPSRGSFYFMEDRALFSMANWFGVRLAGLIPLWTVFLLVLGITTLITFAQEILPILREWRAQSPEPRWEEPPPDLLNLVSELSRGMGMPIPEVQIIQDEEHFLSVVGTRYPIIMVSNDLVQTLNRRLLRNAIAHEMAHIRRRSNSSTLLAFLARALMLYNPVSMLVFRRLIQDDEQICDDLTVAQTQDPQGLADVLKVFQSEPPHHEVSDFSSLNEFISESSHNLLLDERIQRLARRRGPGGKTGWMRPALTASSVAAICYYVV